MTGRRFAPLAGGLLALVGVVVVLALAASGGAFSNPRPAPERYEGTGLEGVAPEFGLTDQRGDALTLADFRGRVVALAFLDPNCTDICPLTAYEFRQSHIALDEQGSSVAFLAINVNPGANSVADVEKATRTWGMEDVPTWHFLTGSRAALERAWTAYGVHGGAPKPGKPGEVEHTPGVFLIDQTGELHRYFSVAFEDAPPLGDLLLEQVRILLDGQE